MGFTKAQMDARFDEIADFAGIGEFIDQPVRTYSSGMFVRLAFSTAMHLMPEILVVDEALAVGDAGFQKNASTRLMLSGSEEGWFSLCPILWSK
jgi:lipopolysaccharide transport system ATP-binding protein